MNNEHNEEPLDNERVKKKLTEILQYHSNRFTNGQIKFLRQCINNGDFEKFNAKLEKYLALQASESINSINSLGAFINGAEDFKTNNKADNRKEISFLNTIINSGNKRNSEILSANKILLKEKNSLEKILLDVNAKNEQLLLKIKSLEVSNEELTSKIQQERIDDKIPGYVDHVKSELSSDDTHFIGMSKTWAKWGGAFGILAVAASFSSLYLKIDFTQVKGFELFYLFTRGLIGISILSWLSYICFSSSKKYTHESIRRKDRRHALMFGQVFLQIYGSTATKEDAIEVFKDWNMSGGSAFSDQTEQPLGLASLIQAGKDKLVSSSPNKTED